MSCNSVKSNRRLTPNSSQRICHMSVPICACVLSSNGNTSVTAYFSMMCMLYSNLIKICKLVMKKRHRFSPVQRRNWISSQYVFYIKIIMMYLYKKPYYAIMFYYTVRWRTAIQDRRCQVRFPIDLLRFFIDLTFWRRIFFFKFWHILYLKCE